MRKKNNIYLSIDKLKKALKEENLAIALDAVEEMRAEKKIGLRKKFLEKLERHLLFILNSLERKKDLLKNHYDKLYRMLENEIVLMG